MAPPKAVDRRSARDLAGLASTPAEDLAALARHDLWRIRAAVAMNPATPIEVLDRLTDDPDLRVRRRVITNPSSTESQWARLVRDPVRANRVRAVVHHPVAAVLIGAAADPYLHHHATHLLRLHLEHDDAGVLGHALAGEADPRLRVLAAHASTIAIDVVERLGRDEAPVVRANLAARDDLPESTALLLARDHEPWVREQIAAGGSLTDAVVKVLRSDPAMRRTLAANHSLDPSQHRALFKLGKAQPAVARASAANPTTPVDVLRKLAAHDRRVDIRASVAGNPAAPSKLLDKLLSSPIMRIRCAAAANPSLSADAMRNAARGWSAMTRFALARNPGLPSDALVVLRDDPDPWVRGIARTHPSATPDDLRSVATRLDDPAWVLRRAALHPACEPDVRDTLLTWLALGGSSGSDPHFDPIECRGNPGDPAIAPLTEWQRLASEIGFGARDCPLWQVRALHVSALGAPEALHEFVDDPMPYVRARCLQRSLFWTDIEVLAHDEDPYVAQTATRLLTQRKVKPEVTAHKSRWNYGWSIGVALVIVTSGIRSCGSDTESSDTRTPAERIAALPSGALSGLAGLAAIQGNETILVLPGGAAVPAQALDPATRVASAVDPLDEGVVQWTVEGFPNDAGLLRGRLKITAGNRPVTVSVVLNGRSSTSRTGRLEPATTLEFVVEAPAGSQLLFRDHTNGADRIYVLRPCTTVRGDGCRR